VLPRPFLLDSLANDSGETTRSTGRGLRTSRKRQSSRVFVIGESGGIAAERQCSTSGKGSIGINHTMHSLSGRFPAPSETRQVNDRQSVPGGDTKADVITRRGGNPPSVSRIPSVAVAVVDKGQISPAVRAGGIRRDELDEPSDDT
jgi:hypothetical protein